MISGFRIKGLRIPSLGFRTGVLGFGVCGKMV